MVEPMSEAAALWSKILPDVRKGVTGVGVWTALNNAKAIAFEDGVLAIGLPHDLGELTGHLRVPATKRLIDQLASAAHGSPVACRILDGNTQQDWETAKRKDIEARRMQEQAMAKMRLELQAKQSWDGVYDQLSRRYAAIPAKSLPQNRARFYEEAVALIAETRQSQTEWDDLGERNFARCIERLTQYTEMPSTQVAIDVLKRSGEL